MKIADGIYAYIWRGFFENNCNMFYFSEPLNMLIDPGLRHHLDLRFEGMKNDGLDPEDVKHVLNTHSHPDHFEGSLYFQEKGASISMHKDEIDFINTVGEDFFAMLGKKFPIIKFDEILQEGKWKVGDTEFEIYHTPGHSPGSICLYWPEKKTLVSGDLIFKESVGRVDIPGGDGAKLKESIEIIETLDIEILLPGHMGYVSGKKDVIRNFDTIRYYLNMM